MNSRLLNALLAKNGHRQRDLAELLGISEGVANHKIHGKKAQFNQGELNLIKSYYKLSPDEMDEIFFNPKVSL